VPLAVLWQWGRRRPRQHAASALLLIGAVAAPIGLWVFRRGEIYAKKHGKLQRSG